MIRSIWIALTLMSVSHPSAGASCAVDLLPEFDRKITQDFELISRYLSASASGRKELRFALDRRLTEKTQYLDFVDQKISVQYELTSADIRPEYAVIAQALFTQILAKKPSKSGLSAPMLRRNIRPAYSIIMDFSRAGLRMLLFSTVALLADYGHFVTFDWARDLTLGWSALNLAVSSYQALDLNRHAVDRIDYFNRLSRNFIRSLTLGEIAAFLRSLQALKSEVPRIHRDYIEALENEALDRQSWLMTVKTKSESLSPESFRAWFDGLCGQGACSLLDSAAK